MTTTQTAPSATTQLWPEGVTHRYLTKAAEITGDLTLAVEIRGSRGSISSRCTGCGQRHALFGERRTHELAQGHAEKCRAVPRPAVTA